MKSDFVASVSHELRAPVASIRLMADALNAGKIEPHTVGEFHRLISREGARLTTLIENVLDFARIEQGRKSWHFEECDLAAVITETVNLMEPLAAGKSITLVFPKPLPSLQTKVDPGAIQQALVNLLDNAIKFSPAGSQVGIMLAESPGNWEIQITDQGPGIPPAEHVRIFEKFHRLGSELRRETQGTGIGLSLVKAVAEAHGGRVVLASAPGKGSVFTLIGPIRPI
jgi:signal transduction histidine kinase